MYTIIIGGSNSKTGSYKALTNVGFQYTIQYKTLAGQNFGGFVTVRKLVEKILPVGHTNNS